MTRFLTRLDLFLMARLFMPVAHYVDWRWHVNHFRLAVYCLRFAYSCFVAGVVLPFLNQPTGWHFASIAIVLCSYVWVRDWDRQLEHASASFERDPSVVPRSAYGFILMPPPVRAMIALSCLNAGGWMLAVALIIHEPGLSLESIYLGMLVPVQYFAGSIPSFRQRKPKKERASMLQPMPAPAA